MKRALPFFAFLLITSSVTLSWATTPGTYPHLTSLCVGQMKAVREFKDSKREVLWSVRHLKSKFLAQLTGDTSPNFEYVYFTGPIEKDKATELDLGATLGRVNQLEYDLTDPKSGTLLIPAEIRGRENINLFSDLVLSKSHEAEEKIALEINKLFPNLNQGRKADLLSHLPDMFAEFAVGFSLLAGWSHIHPSHINPVIGGFLGTAILVRHLYSYVRDILNEKIQEADENSWLYRGRFQIDFFTRLKDELLNQKPDPNQVFYLGSNFYTSSEFARTLINIQDSDQQLRENLLNATILSRKGVSFDENNMSWVLTDTFFYYDSGQPVLVTISRVSKDIAASPPSPKKKNKKPLVERQWEFMPGTLQPIPIRSR